MQDKSSLTKVSRVRLMFGSLGFSGTGIGRLKKLTQLQCWPLRQMAGSTFHSAHFNFKVFFLQVFVAEGVQFSRSTEAVGSQVKRGVKGGGNL